MASGADHTLSARLARQAGSLLLAIRADVTNEAMRGELGDHRSHDFLAAALKAAAPKDAILSEEGIDDHSRLDSDRVWIIDPVDGTREFSEGRTDWAVHVALVEGGGPIAGAVALPARHLVLASRPRPTLLRSKLPAHRARFLRSTSRRCAGSVARSSQEC